MGPSLTRGRTNGHLPLILLALAAAKLAAAQKQQQQPPNQGYFSPPMAAVVVVLVTAFFLLGFFSIYIRRCAGNPLGGPDYPTQLVGPMTLASASRSRRHRGLDTAVLETFPTMAYADVKTHKAGKAALECAVCLSEFDDDETLRLLPKCSHVFHPDCIDAWLTSHVTCPVCRANLVPDPSAPATAPTTEPLDTAATQQPVQEVAPTSASAAPERVAVVIDVEETEEDRVRREEAAELMRIGSLKRALRSKSSRQPARLPRSHSTGHSPAAPASDKSADRFTLKLPEHVLREIVEAGKLQRTTSLLAFRAGRQGSTRRGSRVGEGSSRAVRSVRLGRSDRWPSFVVRTFSAKFPAWGSVRRAADDGSSNLRKVAGAGAVAGNAVECDDQACTLGRRV